MSETLPRWGLPAVEFLTTDAETIQAEIITAYEAISGRTLAAGDPVRLFLLGIADILIQQRNAINTAAQQNLLSYAQDGYLDALGNYLSVDRLSASKATTTLKFTLSQALANDYVVSAGTEVTNGVVTFATDEELIIPAGDLYSSVSATCTTEGAIGNDYLPGQISTLVIGLTFVASAENTTITTGGADQESDAEYAERIRIAPNSFSVAGPVKAYIYHAMSVSSAVIDVSVVSPTPGLVQVYPLLEGGVLPGQEVLDQIKEHLSSDDIRPLTDEVEVLSPVTHEYSIVVDYWISAADKAKAESIRTAVEAAVEEYRLWQQGRIGRDITPAQLICKVVSAGASRIDSATMQPANFVQLEDNTIAQCTGVTITYKGDKPE
jgi:phage-related baseplate assembly protein